MADDKNATTFRQRKDGVSAIRKGPGGREVETKMVTGPGDQKPTPRRRKRSPRDDSEGETETINVLSPLTDD